MDDVVDMPFYREVRWSKARVAAHSGMELVCKRGLPTVYPCRELYRRDNETFQGNRRGLDDMEDHAAYDSDDGGEVYPGEDVDIEDCPETADGEETPIHPEVVDFEPSRRTWRMKC